MTRWCRWGARSALAAAALALLGGLSLTTGANAASSKALTYQTVLKDSLASAMMLGLINQDQALILDKVEGNNQTTTLANGKPVWGVIVNLTDFSVRAIDVETNTFCASGVTLPNGTWAVFGGNKPVTYGGANVDPGQPNPYASLDGRFAIRLMDVVGVADTNLNWVDGTSAPMMNSARWYPGVEVLANGETVIIGGAIAGGYINRNTPNMDPIFESATAGASVRNLNIGGSNPTYEFFPNRTNITASATSWSGMQTSQFMIKTSGLNMYPHTYLMPSGKVFMNANYSNVLWDVNTNTEIPLPDMPNRIVRVYPASAATAMLPLTPDNNYIPTILFCGGSVLPNDDAWGNYTAPNINILQVTASSDCSSITPEDQNGAQTNAGFVTDDALPEGRTMGQFIHLPTGQMLVVNGANKGTAGYGNTPWNTLTINGQQVFTEGFAQDPTYTPVLYDPSASKGSRWSRAGFGSSSIARLYHSSAVLLPDGSVLIGGSNPHVDVHTDMPVGTTPQAFNTSYELEAWYPEYYDLERPQPQGLPSLITFGGKPFTVKMDAAYMGKAANAMAAATKFMVIRPGFSTHAMNMGQRSLQLAHTYAVADDGSVTYTVNMMPTNPNLFVAGPALLFVTINGIPSKGQYISVGVDMKKAGSVPWDVQTYDPLAALPAPTNNKKYDAALPTRGMKLSLTKIIGIAVGGGVALILLAIIIFCCVRRNKKTDPHKTKGGYSYANNPTLGAAGFAERKEPLNEQPPPHMPFAGHSVVPRGSMGTFDSYRMGDMSGSTNESREALGAYFDGNNSGAHSPAPPNASYAGIPRTASPAPSARQLQQQAQQPQFQQQGWGEHRGGDAGETYYNNAAAASNYHEQAHAEQTAAGQYYDYPTSPQPTPLSQYSYHTASSPHPTAGGDMYAQQQQYHQQQQQAYQPQHYSQQSQQYYSAEAR